MSEKVRLTMEYGEVWITPTEFIVCGQPKEDDPEHNCDALGCTSVSHVVFRARLEPQAMGLTSLRTQLTASEERANRAEALLKEAQTLLNDAVKNGCLILGRCELDSRISSFLHDGEVKP